MARPLRVEFSGAFYHVTSRGNEQKDIFKSVRDRERFIEYLLAATQRYGAVVHAYCLMTNHYHLFLETPRANLSQIMRHLNGSYTTYYNVKRKHAGHVLQGRYKGIVVEAEQYALQLSRYMHLNPVRTGIVDVPEDYQWSSYRAYIGYAPSPSWLNRDLVLESFGPDISVSQLRYRQFVEDLTGQEYQSPLNETVASTILGTADFVEWLMAEYLDKETERPDVPAVRRLNHRFSIEQILHNTEELVDDPHLARDVTLHLCHRYSGETLKNIGTHFGLGDSGVAKASFRLQKQLKVDAALRDKVKEILNSLGYVNVQT